MSFHVSLGECIAIPDILPRQEYAQRCQGARGHAAAESLQVRPCVPCSVGCPGMAMLGEAESLKATECGRSITQ